MVRGCFDPVVARGTGPGFTPLLSDDYRFASALNELWSSLGLRLEFCFYATGGGSSQSQHHPADLQDKKFCKYNASAYL